MNSYEQIAYDVADGVATVTLDRPDRLNAFTETMGLELLDVLDRTDVDDDVRAVVVTGRGRAFCAGADLGSGAGTFDPSVQRDRAWGERDGGGVLTLRIAASRKPVIAAINGPAVGVGVTMTLAMDVRIAAEEARFGFVFARRGLVPEAASSWFLPRVVGISQALEWTLTGRVFPAAEALAGGLVRSIHPTGEVLSAARALALEIVDNTAPVAVAATRQMLWRMLGADSPLVAHRLDSRVIDVLGGSADAAEGVSAFLEKRPARFPLTVSRDLPELLPDLAGPARSQP